MGELQQPAARCGVRVGQGRWSLGEWPDMGYWSPAEMRMVCPTRGCLTQGKGESIPALEQLDWRQRPRQGGKVRGCCVGTRQRVVEPCRVRECLYKGQPSTHRKKAVTVTDRGREKIL